MEFAISHVIRNSKHVYVSILTPKLCLIYIYNHFWFINEIIFLHKIDDDWCQSFNTKILIRQPCLFALNHFETMNLMCCTNVNRYLCLDDDAKLMKFTSSTLFPTVPQFYIARQMHFDNIIGKLKYLLSFVVACIRIYCYQMDIQIVQSHG